VKLSLDEFEDGCSHQMIKKDPIMNNTEEERKKKKT
jgi:hypothetical protein